MTTLPGSRVEELQRRLERDPASRLFAQLAEEHRKAGAHGEAIRVARAGLAQHPVYPSARLTLGRALLESGDAGAARSELEEALRQAPDNILASRFLGQALEALGDLAGAIRQFTATLQMTPADEDLAAHVRELSARARPSASPPPLPQAAGPLAATIRLPGGPAPGAPESRRAQLPARPPEPKAAPVAAARPQPSPLTAPAVAHPAVAHPAFAPTGAAPLARPPELEDAGGGAAPFSSSTLAELYLQQGLHAHALEVYRRVVAEDPANERARRRLGELERVAGAVAPGRTNGAAAAWRDPVQARRHAIERAISDLEALLGAIRRGH